jgi:hypothetical protein
MPKGDVSEEGKSDVSPDRGSDWLDPSNPLYIPLIIACGLFVLLLIGLATYFLFISPRRKRRALVDALQMVNENPEQPEEWETIERKLNEALTTGMKNKDIAQARFLLAYARAKMGRYAEAAAVLADLKKEDYEEREIVYLDFWLQHHLEKYEKVERIHQKHKVLLKGFLQTNLIAAIAYLYKARTHWKRREIETAIHYFDMMRELNELTEEIPSHIENHQVVLAVTALFDEDLGEARRQFSGALEKAKETSVSYLQARVGLLLCDWIQKERADINSKLDELVPLMEKTHGCDKFLDQQTAEKTEIKKPAEMKMLFRNILLWRGISLIYKWFEYPKKMGLPDEQRKQLRERLEKVKLVDSEMGDPYLIDGLISYYFARDDEEREKAVEILQKSTEVEVNVPEVLNLIAREKRVKEFEKNILQRYLTHVKSYLTDKSVPEKLRAELKKQLSQRRQFKEIEDVELESPDDAVQPSIVDIQNRSSLWRTRMQKIVKGKIQRDKTEADEKLQSLLDGIEDASKSITKHTKHLVNKENRLMIKTGEFLIADDEPIEATEELSEKE